MLECLFLVMICRGGENHHDGSMQGRVEAEFSVGRCLRQTADQAEALETDPSEWVAHGYYEGEASAW